MTKETGVTAFPVENKWDEPYRHYNGMTLRDYFAAKAMSIIPKKTAYNMKNNEEYEVYIARHSYELADAMLEARK